MANKNYSILTVLIIALVVAVIASLITANITGNVIKVKRDDTRRGVEVYSKEEINRKILVLEDELSGSCKFVHYKDPRPDDLNNAFFGVNIDKACEEISTSLLLHPIMVTERSHTSLYNREDCPSSYMIFSSRSSNLDSYSSSEYGESELGTLEEVDDRCENMRFLDGLSNGGFSELTTATIEGVLCCDN